jgi:hypothetical protein
MSLATNALYYLATVYIGKYSVRMLRLWLGMHEKHIFPNLLLRSVWYLLSDSLRPCLPSTTRFLQLSNASQEAVDKQ